MEEQKEDKPKKNKREREYRIVKQYDGFYKCYIWSLERRMRIWWLPRLRLNLWMPVEESSRAAVIPGPDPKWRQLNIVSEIEKPYIP